MSNKSPDTNIPLYHYPSMTACNCESEFETYEAFIHILMKDATWVYNKGIADFFRDVLSENNPNHSRFIDFIENEINEIREEKRKTMLKVIRAKKFVKGRKVKQKKTNK